jgi:hypothetical protein
MAGKRTFSKVILVLIALFVIIQFFTVTHDNPPVRADLSVSVELHDIMKRSCYDCHSNETIWPWYSYVAPSSWLVADDVHGAREHLNFSDWETMSPIDQAEEKKRIWHHVKEDEMPLSQYLMLHPEAKLSDQDKAVIEQWATAPAPTSETAPADEAHGEGEDD